MKYTTLESVNSAKPIDSRLTAIEFQPPKPRRMIVVKCECGIIKMIPQAQFINGAIKSCGCLLKESRIAQGMSIEEINKRKHIRSRLTALEFVGAITSTGHKHRLVKCLCSCGSISTKRASLIINGKVISCGCAQAADAEYVIFKNINIYHSYTAMLHRCYDIKDQAYKNYGGRGVIVCDEWKNDFRAFLKWSLENGWKKWLQLDKDII